MRIDKLLSNLKYGSRKEVKDMLKRRLVSVNGEIVIDSNYQINPTIDEITINDERLIYFEQVSLAINKPTGYVSANKDNLHKTVMELLGKPYDRYDLKIAGRLDLDSEGLIILTTEGDFVHKITAPNNEVFKTYEVVLDKEHCECDKLIAGVWIKDGNNNQYLAKAKEVNMIAKNKVRIVISEGKFHQVKRMFQAIGCIVLELKRTQIGKLKLENLKPGEYREIRKEEVIWRKF